MRQSYSDIALVQEWYRLAAEKGHPTAVCLLANTESWDFYDKKWMAVGVQLKIEECLYRSAQAYQFGASGYPKNPEMVKMLNTECDHISQLRNRLPYKITQQGSLNGVEVEACFQQYRQSLEAQFNNGHPEIGMQLFELFRGLDNDKAVSWLRRGAELNPVCAKQLADLYQDGSCGLPIDRESFYQWFLHSRDLEKHQATEKK
jgi:TPR repeat protein